MLNFQFSYGYEPVGPRVVFSAATTRWFCWTRTRFSPQTSSPTGSSSGSGSRQAHLFFLREEVPLPLGGGTSSIRKGISSPRETVSASRRRRYLFHQEEVPLPSGKVPLPSGGGTSSLRKGTSYLRRSYLFRQEVVHLPSRIRYPLPLGGGTSSPSLI